MVDKHFLNDKRRQVTGISTESCALESRVAIWSECSQTIQAQPQPEPKPLSGSLVWCTQTCIALSQNTVVIIIFTSRNFSSGPSDDRW